MALAIHLGYEEIWLYGSELTSGTEYAYQAINLAFWIGFAYGYGVDFHLECWQSEFEAPIYGYEGEMQVPREFFEGRVRELETVCRVNAGGLEKLKSRVEQEIYANNFQKAAELSVALETAATNVGEGQGALGEARRYLGREDMISRQEFERVSAQAQKDGDQLKDKVSHAGGKCEYVWNVWLQTGRAEARAQFQRLTREKTELALQMGVKLGVMRENFQYIYEYDRLVTALGGVRAVSQLRVDS